MTKGDPNAFRTIREKWQAREDKRRLAEMKKWEEEIARYAKMLPSGTTITGTGGFHIAGTGHHYGGVLPGSLWSDVPKAIKTSVRFVDLTTGSNEVHQIEVNWGASLPFVLLLRSSEGVYGLTPLTNDVGRADSFEHLMSVSDPVLTDNGRAELRKRVAPWFEAPMAEPRPNDGVYTFDEEAGF